MSGCLGNGVMEGMEPDATQLNTGAEQAGTGMRGRRTHSPLLLRAWNVGQAVGEAEV